MKKIIKKMYQVIKKDFPFYFALAILISLLFKNPYSLRTLIPNFEPFPDTFHYLSPAKCLVESGEFNMCLNEREGTKQSVPPLYSIAMIPFFTINSDPRSIYFLNILLSVISLIFLYKIIQSISKNKLIICASLLIYVTSYFSYWFPSLIMAENIMIPIFLAGIYLLTIKSSKTRSILAGLIAAGLYGSKYAALGLSASYTLIYGLYLVLNTKIAKKRYLNLFIFLATAIFFYLIFGGWNTVQGVIKFFLPIFYQSGIIKTISSENQSHSWYASPNNMINNLLFYINGFILGKPLRILWDSRILLPKLIGLTSIVGLIMGSIKRKCRWLSLNLIFLSISQIIPILPFYVADGRYAITLLPTLIIGFSIFLKIIDKKIEKEKVSKHTLTFIVFVFIISIFHSRAKDLRLQLSLNLKYAETPWWYVATQTMNNYFAKNESKKTTSLITLTSPYYLDYFSNNKYKPLPLSESQDFRDKSNLVWGIDEDKKLIEIYLEKLHNDERVYITNYGIIATQGFQDEFKNIEEKFALIQVDSGCYELCNIYQLQIKE